MSPLRRGRGAAGVTQLPAPAAATWDTDLMGRYGQTIGAEEWGKGATVVLGPTINVGDIRSQGPMVQVKHYADYWRTPTR